MYLELSDELRNLAFQEYKKNKILWSDREMLAQKLSQLPAYKYIGGSMYDPTRGIDSLNNLEKFGALYWFIGGAPFESFVEYVRIDIPIEVGIGHDAYFFFRP